MPWSINAGNKFYDYFTYKWFTTTTDAGGMPVRDAILDPDTISLYPDAAYEGPQLRLAPGDYTSADLQALGFIRTNSMMVPFDFRVTLFTEDNLDGPFEVHTTTIADLLNINVRSIRVEFLNTY